MSVHIFFTDITYLYALFPHIVIQCDARELGEAVERNQTDCPVGHRAASTKNGVICYTGTVIGSLAYTICNKGYKDGTANFSTVKCLEDGHWSLTQQHLECSPIEKGDRLRLLAKIFCSVISLIFFLQILVL